jgi:hypothetical protein
MHVVTVADQDNVGFRIRPRPARDVLLVVPEFTEDGFQACCDRSTEPGIEELHEI